jgi:hypothetical protein
MESIENIGQNCRRLEKMTVVFETKILPVED